LFLFTILRYCVYTFCIILTINGGIGIWHIAKKQGTAKSGSDVIGKLGMGGFLCRH
jgi:hypothetical protein